MYRSDRREREMRVGRAVDRGERYIFYFMMIFFTVFPSPMCANLEAKYVVRIVYATA